MIKVRQLACPDDENARWSSNDERRAAVRCRAALRVAFRVVDEAGSCGGEAPVRDISNLGIGLVLPQPLPLSGLVDLELRSTRSAFLRPVLARVVHVVEETLRSWIVGCAFTTELTAEELGLFSAEAVRPKVPDSRRWIRFPCNVETVCYTCETTPGERRPARILNVSPGGIGLLLPCQFSQGTLLNFDLPAAVNRPERSLLVRVVRVIEQSAGVWFLGCEFVQRIDDDELRTLLR